MARKSVRLGNVLLCDYVAKGENNKFVLVNAYSGDIVVQHFPATLPLGLYCEYLPEGLGHLNLTLSVKVGGHLLVEANVVMEVLELAPQVIAIPQFFANIEDAATIEILIVAEGYKSTVALTKNIRIGIFGGSHMPPSQPYSEQAQPPSKG